MRRHPTTHTWTFPPERPPPPAGLDRINLRELVARADRFEHHLIICARVGPAQLEIVTASEPLYFAHVNLSDEYAVALPTGDALLDHVPFRTFISDPITGADVARYNHRAGDVVLHPVGFAHWPGRLRPPYEGLAIPPGMRRCGLSLVFCAGTPTASNARVVPLAAARAADVKAYASAPSKSTTSPVLSLAPLDGPPGVLATIGTTSLELVERPTAIAPPRGGWVVVIEGDAPGDLFRIPPGARLDGAGIVRALVFSGDAAPEPVPPSWRELPPPPFAPFEDAPRGELPVVYADLRVEAVSPRTVAVMLADAVAEVPRYWLARMLFRVGLHGLRLGYLETYGGFFVDDSGPDIRVGLRIDHRSLDVTIPRTEALAFVERLYRAVAPADYRERLE